jgi:putative restriction endonuclease
MTPDDWLAKLARLRVDRARGNPAPHKPLLLLTVLELAERGELPADILPLTAELAFRFFGYWSLVARRRPQKPDIRMPFHYLQSDGLWTAHKQDGTPSEHLRLTRSAVLNPGFVACTADPAWRVRARRVLIASYFTHAEQLALFEFIGMPVPGRGELARDLDLAARRDAARKGREARFSVTVVGAYNYTCALTGYRLTTISGAIVDAAHIHEFSNSRNNDPRNGIALCKNAHWLFDQGLWSLSDDYQVMVALGQYAEDSPDQKGLAHYHGRKIRLPKDTSLWPDPRYLAWHRRKKFRSG